MKRYELRFVTSRGRVLRGPIIKKKDIKEFYDVIRKVDDMTVFRMHFGSHYFVIPKETLLTGHAEIKPVGLLYTMVRCWRAR